MDKCPVCGNKTASPWLAAFEHFRLIEFGQWQYWRGNIRQFGFWDGLSASINLSFPILNTLRNWKYRRATLVIPGVTHPIGRLVKRKKDQP